MAIISSIGSISVFLLLLLAGFLFSHKSQNRVGNVLFATFLLVTSLDISGQFLGDFYRDYVFINNLRMAFVFLQMPLLYFYVKRACFSDFKLEPKLFWHSIPTFIWLFIFFLFGISNQLEVVYIITVQLQYYLYIGAIFLMLRNYKRIHNKYHSLQSETYRWLMTATVLFLIGNSAVLFRGIFEAFNGFQRFPLLNLGIALFALFVITWFVLKTMRNPELFTRVNQTTTSPKKSVIEEWDQLQDEQDQLHQYMITHKPYLEEALTLQQLAEKTEIPAKRLSFLINQKIGKHFYDYVNAYRIEESKRLLKKSDFTIQQIMYEVGFNSKSSFNTAFKKNTSLTPSSFRNQST